MGTSARAKVRLRRADLGGAVAQLAKRLGSLLPHCLPADEAARELAVLQEAHRVPHLVERQLALPRRLPASDPSAEREGLPPQEQLGGAYRP